MGILARCWEGVRSAVTSASTYVYAARGVVFVAGMATIVIRELGWDKIFGYEAACDLTTFNCEPSCELSETLQTVIPYVVYGVQALSTSLMVAAYSPNFWGSTDLSKISSHFFPIKEQYSEPLTPKMKVGFGVLIGGAVAYYGVGILRNYLGSLEELEIEFNVDKQYADPLAIAMTALWGLVSVGVKMPDFIAGAYKSCENPSLPKSPLRITVLGLLGVATGVSMADYLSRFIESRHQDVDDYITMLVAAGVFAFIFSIFTSGSSLDAIPNLMAKLRTRTALPVSVAVLLSVDALVWWIFNTVQLSGRIEAWVAAPNMTVTGNSTLFKELCRVQVENRQVDPKDHIIITVCSAFLAMPLTGCMALYMAKLMLLSDRREHRGDEEIYALLPGSPAIN